MFRCSGLRCLDQTEGSRRAAYHACDVGKANNHFWVFAFRHRRNLWSVATNRQLSQQIPFLLRSGGISSQKWRKNCRTLSGPLHKVDAAYYAASTLCSEPSSNRYGSIVWGHRTENASDSLSQISQKSLRSWKYRTMHPDTFFQN